MFAVPRLPSLPSYLHPSALMAPIKALITPPELVDYDSIPIKPRHDHEGTPSREAHSGILAKLPPESCPICHLRRVSVPRPIAQGSSGAAISLPPVEVDEGQEEERIFVPAQTNCWGGCRWCYYCIAGELASHNQQIAAGPGEEETDEKGNVNWTCLRCGGGVTRAWRVGPNQVEMDDVEKSVVFVEKDDLEDR